MGERPLVCVPLCECERVDVCARVDVCIGDEGEDTETKWQS